MAPRLSLTPHSRGSVKAPGPWEGEARPRLRADSTAQVASGLAPLGLVGLGKLLGRSACLPPSAIPPGVSYDQRHDLGQVTSFPEEARRDLEGT